MSMRLEHGVSGTEASRYCGKSVVLTTKHAKESSIALPLRAGLGLNVESLALDTDVLGTFTGEIERRGTAFDAALEKARMGMTASGNPLGIASEGSFGPHPFIPFIALSQEILVFIDEELGMHVKEGVVTEKTNFGHTTVRSVDEARDFLERALFPSHALIARPNKSSGGQIIKGITEARSLIDAIEICARRSEDGLAFIETDMRAHFNPTRRKAIRRAAIKLARRLRVLCSKCGTPGFGLTDYEPGLPCSDCGYPSEAPQFEIHSCPLCNEQQFLPRRDGLKYVSPGDCQQCNP
jgi:hypothetical protein